MSSVITQTAHSLLTTPESRTPILQRMLSPRAVALVGATEAAQSVGRKLTENLLPLGKGFYPINPKRSTVLGVKAFPNITEVPMPVDLAVIATPASMVPDVIGDCEKAGVPGALIISDGFRECGAAGIELEQQILARRGRMRIIGPNCLGVMIPELGLNATFAKSMALRGNVAFISESGALCASVLDWSLRERVGFSAFFSIGSMLDVGWGDLIDYLADDFHTQSILIYMETIGDARSFLSAAREVALRKPIIVIKAGCTEAAGRAVASHTGTVTANDAALDAAFRRVGVLRVRTIEDLFDMAEVLSKQPRPKGPRLAIVTNAGGPGVLAADMLVAEGGEIAPLSKESMQRLDTVLPSHWSRNNPIDVLGDADGDRFGKAVEIVSSDPNNDGILAIVTPQTMTDAAAIAKGLQRFRRLPGKPILASWMGAAEVADGETILNASGIPTFEYPDAAARSFCYMWRYSDSLRGLYETPALSAGEFNDSAARTQTQTIIRAAQKANRTLLTEIESKAILEAYGIPTVKTLIARSAEEAVQAAAKLGSPVVLKLHSEKIAHKTDVGGVKLNLRTKTEIQQAYFDIEKSVRAIPGAFLGVVVEPMIQSDGYELIFGSSIDPQFGPVLLFGSGGQLVEVVKDCALGLPPLNATLARRLMEQTHIFTALKGVRGRPPIDLAHLERVLVQFSLLVAEQSWIKEIDINPFLVSATQMLALDARIVLHGQNVRPEDLPRLAIRPYPQQYCSNWKLRDGTPVNIRPIRPEDEPLMVKFHGTLSDKTVHFRYFAFSKLELRVAHERLTQICFNDFDRDIALVVIRRRPGAKEDEIIAVGRLVKVHGMNEAEFAIVISDLFQRQGLGTHLLQLLVNIGQQEGIERIFGQILPDNYGMQRVSKKVGFTVSFDRENEVMRAEIKLQPII
jgi:acetyltransferase